MLRNYIRYDQSDWDKWLPIVEYAYNDTRHSSTGMMPFYADYGRVISPIIRQLNTETNINATDKLATKLINIKNTISTSLVQATQ